MPGREHARSESERESTRSLMVKEAEKQWSARRRRKSCSKFAYISRRLAVAAYLLPCCRPSAGCGRARRKAASSSPISSSARSVLRAIHHRVCTLSVCALLRCKRARSLLWSAIIVTFLVPQQTMGLRACTCDKVMKIGPMVTALVLGQRTHTHQLSVTHDLRGCRLGENCFVAIEWRKAQKTPIETCEIL